MNDRAQARPTVIIDNQRVIVTGWRSGADAETGWHRHNPIVAPQTT